MPTELLQKISISPLPMRMRDIDSIDKLRVLQYAARPHILNQ